MIAADEFPAALSDLAIGKLRERLYATTDAVPRLINRYIVAETPEFISGAEPR
jgi:hypothetical protein